MNARQIIESQGGDGELHDILHYLAYSAPYQMQSHIFMSVGQESIINRIDNVKSDPKTILQDAIKRYVQKNPESYNPVFNSFMTPDEIKNLSMSLKEVA